MLERVGLRGRGSRAPPGPAAGRGRRRHGRSDGRSARRRPARTRPRAGLRNARRISTTPMWVSSSSVSRDIAALGARRTRSSSESRVDRRAEAVSDRKRADCDPRLLAPRVASAGAGSARWRQVHRSRRDGAGSGRVRAESPVGSPAESRSPRAATRSPRRSRGAREPPTSGGGSARTRVQDGGLAGAPADRPRQRAANAPRPGATGGAASSASSVPARMQLDDRDRLGAAGTRPPPGRPGRTIGGDPERGVDTCEERTRPRTAASNGRPTGRHTSDGRGRRPSSPTAGDDPVTSRSPILTNDGRPTPRGLAWRRAGSRSLRNARRARGA